MSTPPSQDGEFTFMGTVDGSNVRFEFETDYERAPPPITPTGSVTVDEMAEPVDFGGLAVENWSALRSEDE